MTMQTAVSLAVLVPALVACGGAWQNANSDTLVAASSCAGEPFGESFMRAVIGTLAQPSWGGRKFDGEGLERATRWVRDQFECIGLTPGAANLPGLPSASFEHPFETDGDEMEAADAIPNYTYDAAKRYTFTNVLGSIPGRGELAGEVIVVGAHIDHLGEHSVDGGVVLGADDDASGVLALLSMAKQILGESAPAHRRTIVFAAWGIEEDPFYLRGSQAFFEALDAAGPTSADRIMYYVNFDMVGGYRYHERLNVMGTFDAAPDAGYAASPARVLMTTIKARYPDIQTDLGDRGASSDHATFCENGIPYAFFWTEDDCYHKPCDTLENVDFAHLGSILRMATDLTKALATAPDLKSAKDEFPEAYLAAYPGKTCASQE